MSGTLIYKKQIISGAPEVYDEVKAADMRPVTSNAVLKWGEKKVISVVGEIINCDINTSTNVSGKGRAIITLEKGLAKIDFTAYITRAGTGNLFGVGLNRDLLRGLNNLIPVIAPVTGLCHYYNEAGDLDTNLEGYGGNISPVGQYWQFGRFYTESMDFGGWPASTYYKGLRIIGTCYGRYSS